MLQNKIYFLQSLADFVSNAINAKSFSKSVAYGILGCCLYLLSGLSGCSKQKSFSYVTYEGTAYDPSGQALKDCNVFLDACVPNDARNQCTTFSVGKATTDAAGHFRIHEKAARSGRYFVTAGGGTPYNDLFFDDVNVSALSSAKCTQLYFK